MNDNQSSTLRSRLIAILARNADRPEQTVDEIMEMFGETLKRDMCSCGIDVIDRGNTELMQNCCIKCNKFIF